MDTVFTNSSFGDFGPVMELALCNPHFGDFWPLLPADGNMLLIFRGENRLQDIDYTEIVAARIGSGDVTIDSPPHLLETNYFYAARQVSVYGRLEHNMTVVEKFRLASDGEPESDRPDHVTALTGEASAGGEIKLKFSHRKINGTTPARFNVYYDGGLGAGYIGDDAAVDPDCVLLLHFDGDDGDTATIDSSGSGHTVTTSGDFELDDAQKKFGNTSGKITGAGSKVAIGAHADFNFSDDDFTIMAWFRINKASGIATTFNIYNQIDSGINKIQLYYHYDLANPPFNELLFGVFTPVSQYVYLHPYVGSLDDDVWYHICIARSGNTWRLFLDGTLKDSITKECTMPTVSADIEANVTQAADMLWIDDLVVTKQALYTAAFDVPARSYGASLGEVDYRGDGSYVFTTEVLTDGTRYHFAVTAEDSDGSEDRFNRVVSAVADSSVPEALTGITTEVVF